MGPLSPWCETSNIPVISAGFAQLMVVPLLDLHNQQASQRPFSAQCSDLLPYPETAGALEHDFPMSALWSRNQEVSRISPPLAQTTITHRQTVTAFPGLSSTKSLLVSHNYAANHRCTKNILPSSQHIIESTKSSLVAGSRRVCIP